MGDLGLDAQVEGGGCVHRFGAFEWPVHWECECYTVGIVVEKCSTGLSTIYL